MKDDDFGIRLIQYFKTVRIGWSGTFWWPSKTPSKPGCFILVGWEGRRSINLI